MAQCDRSVKISSSKRALCIHDTPTCSPLLMLTPHGAQMDQVDPSLGERTNKLTPVSVINKKKVAMVQGVSI